MLDKLALRVKESRDATFVAPTPRATRSTAPRGRLRRRRRLQQRGGYFAAKMMRTLGVVHIEQQARV
jgi:formate dehydrogenase major subunit